MNEEKETVMDKMLAKYKVLKKEADIDCKFELTNVDNGFNNTNNIVKWLKSRSDWQAVYRAFEVQRKKTYRELYEFYCTDYPRRLNSKEEYALFIESDESYNNVYQQSLLAKDIIQFCDSIIEALKGRGFLLKNAIEWLNYKAGK